MGKDVLQSRDDEVTLERTVPITVKDVMVYVISLQTKTQEPESCHDIRRLVDLVNFVT